jgi:thiol-disulfide isomerase/thioredoxin
MRLPFLSLAVAATLIGGTAPSPTAAQLPDEGAMPSIAGATTWLNSTRLTNASLRGKVVLIDFWTYSCVNCLRALPYVTAWDAKYRSQGLVVIGVHTPEFDFEHDSANVRKALTKFGITYPVALDNELKVWNAFKNQYWPAHYVIDVNGRVRHHHFGEGKYDETEQVIRTLLAEAKSPMSAMSDTARRVVGSGASAASDRKNVKSPETYLGYGRARHFASTPLVLADASRVYATPGTLARNQWGFTGAWKITRSYSESTAIGTSITYRFHARDVNLVLGPAANGKAIRFTVTIDGQAPGPDAGMDVDANGTGVIKEHRLYQLVRQRGTIRDHTITITFEQPGVRAYAFTFG